MCMHSGCTVGAARDSVTCSIVMYFFHRTVYPRVAHAKYPYTNTCTKELAATRNQWLVMRAFSKAQNRNRTLV